LAPVPAAGDLGIAPTFHHRDVVVALQVGPELRAVARVASRPNGRIRRGRAPAIRDIGQDIGDAVRRASIDEQKARQFVRAYERLLTLARRPSRFLDRILVIPAVAGHELYTSRQLNVCCGRGLSVVDPERETAAWREHVDRRRSGKFGGHCSAPSPCTPRYARREISVLILFNIILCLSFAWNASQEISAWLQYMHRGFCLI